MKRKIGYAFLFVGVLMIIAGVIIWKEKPEITSILLIAGGILSTIGGVLLGRIRNR